MSKSFFYILTVYSFSTSFVSDLKHSFSLEQLTPNSNSKLIVSSVFTIETGTGVNIFDLVEKIEIKIKNKNLCFRVNEMIAVTLGKDFEKSFDVFFDYQFAVDSILHFNSIDIPTINNSQISTSIMNVRFDCDFTNVKSVYKMKTKSKLHNSLF